MLGRNCEINFFQLNNVNSLPTSSPEHKDDFRPVVWSEDDYDLQQPAEDTSKVGNPPMWRTTSGCIEDHDRESDIDSDYPVINFAAAQSRKSAYHVMVQYNSRFCSGALIGVRVILTVASCFPKNNLPNNISVKFRGGVGLIDGQDIKVIKVIIHEFYAYRTPLDNNVALVVVEKKPRALGIFVRNVNIWPTEPLPDSSTSFKITSYGHLSPKYLRPLQEVPLFMEKTENCQTLLPKYFSLSVFCAKHYSREVKDIGCPAVMKYMDKEYLVGLLSIHKLRKRCNTSNSPSVPEEVNESLFTNVTLYNKWIAKTIKNILREECAKQPKFMDLRGQGRCDVEI